MSLVDLGKRLLEAARKGQDDEVRNLMANGAPFTTDWVRHNFHADVTVLVCMFLQREQSSGRSLQVHRTKMKAVRSSQSVPPLSLS